ncbi:ROK family protein [Actinoplanes xinjiangensis]|uniref:ROK family protein n=1 Tax=Actinoplanes xinjiangensis TaxID=512350 RepID=UPI003F4D7996
MPATCCSSAATSTPGPGWCPADGRTPGAIGYAGEVGHLTVREIGPLCLCGRRGSLSAFLSPGYFAAVSDGGPPDESRLPARAASGDRPARPWPPRSPWFPQLSAGTPRRWGRSGRWCEVAVPSRCRDRIETLRL